MLQARRERALAEKSKSAEETENELRRELKKVKAELDKATKQLADSGQLGLSLQAQHEQQLEEERIKRVEHLAQAEAHRGGDALAQGLGRGGGGQGGGGAEAAPGDGGLLARLDRDGAAREGTRTTPGDPTGKRELRLVPEARCLVPRLCSQRLNV